MHQRVRIGWFRRVGLALATLALLMSTLPSTVPSWAQRGTALDPQLPLFAQGKVDKHRYLAERAAYGALRGGGAAQPELRARALRVLDQRSSPPGMLVGDTRANTTTWTP